MPPRPFFEKVELQTVQSAGALIPNCGACKIHQSCKTPFMKVHGRGNKGILILGEAPGPEDDSRGRQFTGPDGQELSMRLRKVGIDLINDCWLFTALSCHPKNGVTNHPKAAEYCRANVIKTIRELKPSLIIPLGQAAVDSVIGWLWKESVGPIGRWVEFAIPHRKLNCWIVPNYSMSQVLQNQHDEVLSLIFNRNLELAAQRLNKGRPWKPVQAKRDFASEVEVILSPAKAAKRIADFHDKVVAFDYETTMLKPESKEAEIVSCSLSDGIETIAFPWSGEKLIRAMKCFLTDPKTLKVASHKKFESRWTRCKLGVEVNKWHPMGDTMLTAHALDNGEKASQKKAGRAIASIKFQAFVMLGVDAWDTSITPYLRSSNDDQAKKGSYAKNRIKQCNLRDLLIYNGLDSLYEILTHKTQMWRLRRE